MKKLLKFFILLFISVPNIVVAKSTIIEGDEAEKIYTANKGKAQVLVQKNKEFILRTPDGRESVKPATITVKAGERFYIANEEDTFVHNVYDVTDSSWVLKKQSPSTIAAIQFDTPGKRSLRCAIHPKMKIDVEIVK